MWGIEMMEWKWEGGVRKKTSWEKERGKDRGGNSVNGGD